MKNKSLLTIALLAIGACAACTLNVPWEVMGDYDGVYVVMRVVPDDADVLLNGRFIGAAYEFATSRSSLRLASRENELILRKKGFREAVVDLRSYSSRHITLKIELEREIAPAAKPAEPAQTPPAEDKQAYEAQSEPLPPQPAEKPEPAEERSLTLVTLTVTPEETAVYIDGKFWGLAPSAGETASLRLKPGTYTVTAFKPGFQTYSKEITVPKQEKFALAIALKK